MPYIGGKGGKGLYAVYGWKGLYAIYRGEEGGDVLREKIIFLLPHPKQKQFRCHLPPGAQLSERMASLGIIGDAMHRLNFSDHHRSIVLKGLRE